MIRNIFKSAFTSLFLILVLSFSFKAQNLITNPDAETGDITGWVDVDDAWTASTTITPHSGKYFFWPSKKDIPFTEIYQDIDLSSYQSSINTGNLWYNLSGWLANWDQYPHDRATLALEALNSSGEQLLYVSRDHRSPTWTNYQLEGKIPVGTIKVRIHLIATRFVGSDNDGYFDDLSFTLSESAPTIHVIISSPNNQSEIEVGSTLQLTATTMGGTDNEYDWNSSFDAIATVDNTGLVTTKKAGKFTIQAVGKNTGKIGSIELTAYNPEDIVFVSPKSDDEWLKNTSKEITWNVKGNISTGTLFYSTNGGTDWNEIATIDTVQAGHYFWMIPDFQTAFNNCYLKMVWNGGESISSKFSIVLTLTGIEYEKDSPMVSDYKLWNAYPNPFNPTTKIKYSIPNVGNGKHVNLTVYNSLGSAVATLVNKEQAPGTYEVTFSAGNLSSGVYFYRLISGNIVLTKKMILMK